MPVVIDGITYDYQNSKYVPGFNRLFSTDRTISGDVARVDTNVLERTYKFTLYCSLDQYHSLLNSFLTTSTVTFIDEEGVTYDVYFMAPLSVQMVSPLGINVCNQYWIDVTLMVNGQT